MDTFIWKRKTIKRFIDKEFKIEQEVLHNILDNNAFIKTYEIEKYRVFTYFEKHLKKYRIVRFFMFQRMRDK